MGTPESLQTGSMVGSHRQEIRLLSIVQIRKNEFDSAIENLRQAINILEAVGNPRKLWEAHADLGLAFHENGRSGEARNQWGAAKKVIQHTANAISDCQLKEKFLAAKPIKGILNRAG